MVVKNRKINLQLIWFELTWPNLLLFLHLPLLRPDIRLKFCFFNHFMISAFLLRVVIFSQQPKRPRTMNETDLFIVNFQIRGLYYKGRIFRSSLELVIEVNEGSNHESMIFVESVFLFLKLKGTRLSRLDITYYVTWLLTSSVTS